MFLKLTTFFLLSSIIEVTVAQNRDPCSSLIYCQGPLLHTVQVAKLFNDSKTFVDMAIKFTANSTLEDFNLLMMQTNKKPTKEQLQDFVVQHFVTIGELEEFMPKDYKYEPRLIRELEDPSVRNFARALVGIWPSLARVVSNDVRIRPDKYSMIPLENGFIIPGGRFKEIYYWDSYWIIKGLLLSDMHQTAKGMIENLLSLVERFGFVPNGSRIYYLNRSQPPLLTLIVDDYITFTNDLLFLNQHVKTLEKELLFWLDKRVVQIEINGSIYRLAHFDSDSDTPRPESYLEDLETCSIHPKEDEKFDCFQDLKSGAESGWDFTSRWIFDKHGGNDANLSYIQTRRIIPVDLNSFLYRAFFVLHNFFLILRETDNAEFWLDRALEWRKNIDFIMYNDEDGIWYDYDLKLEKHRKYFYPSNITPLWAAAVNSSKKANKGKRALDYFLRENVFEYQGGIPSSLIFTGEQWDFPNAWSPMQGIVIFGLELSGCPEAQSAAQSLAKTWVKSNIKAYTENKVMFEKYNAQQSGQFGSGGEYHIQAGFGWSNGLILELINYYYRVKTRKYKHFN